MLFAADVGQNVILGPTQTHVCSSEDFAKTEPSSFLEAPRPRFGVRRSLTPTSFFPGGAGEDKNGEWKSGFFTVEANVLFVLILLELFMHWRLGKDDFLRLPQTPMHEQLQQIQHEEHIGFHREEARLP